MLYETEKKSFSFPVIKILHSNRKIFIWFPTHWENLLYHHFFEICLTGERLTQYLQTAFHTMASALPTSSEIMRGSFFMSETLFSRNS